MSSVFQMPENRDNLLSLISHKLFFPLISLLYVPTGTILVFAVISIRHICNFSKVSAFHTSNRDFISWTLSQNFEKTMVEKIVTERVRVLFCFNFY